MTSVTKSRGAAVSRSLNRWVVPLHRDVWVLERVSATAILKSLPSLVRIQMVEFTAWAV